MRTRWLLGCLVALHVVLGFAHAREPAPGDGARPAVTSPVQRATRGVAGEVAAADLPPEARTVLAAIRRGGPFAYAKDGTTFFNREGHLPRRSRGYYSEYTVRTPGARDRGARRIVAGGDSARSGEYWYTPDHYRSFLRIRE